MIKVQLFEFKKSREIVLVNLSASEMTDAGEMKGWAIHKDSNLESFENIEMKKLRVTWDDLESDALLLTWAEIPELVKQKFKEVIDKIDQYREKISINRDLEDFAQGDYPRKRLGM